MAGELDSDRNIYIIKDGHRTGEILGQMFTRYSFFSSKNELIKSTIDPNNDTGNIFLTEVQATVPLLTDYIGFRGLENSGKNFGRYDFKSNGISEVQEMSKEAFNVDLYYYRGMPISISGKTYYGTARDVGNYAAGYIAARNGLGIISTLLGFDIYQSYTMKRLEIEPPVSRVPQLWGYWQGYGEYLKKNSVQIKAF